MSTYTQILYQIVYSTWNREQTLNVKNREELFKYIWGILKNKKCHLYRIGGISDHLHILTHIHLTISLASLVKDIKLASNEYIKNTNLFPKFTCWQEACLSKPRRRQGYAAFTYAFKDKNRLIEYVKNQETHHHLKTFKEELLDLLSEHGIEFDEKYLL